MDIQLINYYNPYWSNSLNAMTNDTPRMIDYYNKDKECCICWEITTKEDWSTYFDDEDKARTRTCATCNGFVCMVCFDKMSADIDRFKCPLCRTIDYKHYYQEAILGSIKYHYLDEESIDYRLWEKYEQEDEVPPILYYIDLYMNEDSEIYDPVVDDY